jgi:hypothetical protein
MSRTHTRVAVKVHTKCIRGIDVSLCHGESGQVSSEASVSTCDGMSPMSDGTGELGWACPLPTSQSGWVSYPLSPRRRGKKSHYSHGCPRHNSPFKPAHSKARRQVRLPSVSQSSPQLLSPTKTISTGPESAKEESQAWDGPWRLEQRA